MSTLGQIDLNELIQQLSDSADPVMYQYFKNLNNRTIIINEDIGEASIETVALPLLELDNDGSGKPIKILLNTNGGDVGVGLLICDIIENLKTSTEIILLANGYSMGSLILMSGYSNPNVTRKCYRFSTALVHGGSTYIGGTSMQVRDFHNFQQKYEKKIREFIISHSAITEDEYDKMERYEWYFTAEDMIEKKLVEEII